MTGGIIGASSLWEVLGNYVASVEESVHEISFTSVNFANDSYLVLTVDGRATGLGTRSLRLRMSGATSGYLTDGREIRDGVETLIDVASSSHGQLLSTAILNNGEDFIGIITIQASASGTGRLFAMYHLSSDDVRVDAVGNIHLLGNRPSISSVEISMSAFDWIVGTRFTLYRVKRS